MANMTVYHGGYMPVESPEIRIGRNTKDFKDMTDDWLDFIIDCRSGKKHDYDIVIGAVRR